MASRCFPLLHSDNPVVMRSALEALMDIQAPGAVRDLEILFDASPDDVKEQILDTVATIPSKDSLAFLARVVERYPQVSSIGAKARTLRQSASALMVISGTDATRPPSSAVLLRDQKAGFKLAVLNSDGFRLMIEGTVEVSCTRGRATKSTIAPSVFDPDGTLLLPERCSGTKTPTVQWIRPNGQRLDARLDE